MNDKFFETFEPVRQGYTIDQIKTMSNSEKSELLIRFFKKCSENFEFELFNDFLNYTNEKETDYAVANLILYSDHSKWIEFLSKFKNTDFKHSCIMSYVVGFKDFFKDLPDNDKNFFYKQAATVILFIAYHSKNEESKEYLNFDFNFNVNTSPFNIQDILKLEKQNKRDGLSILYSLPKWTDPIENVLFEFYEDYAKDILNEIANPPQDKILQLKMKEF